MLFVFLSENWKCFEEEVSVFMELFNFVFNSEVKCLYKNGVCLQVIGDVEVFDVKLVEKICKVEDMIKDNKDLVLNIVVNYGGRWDIVNVVK